MQLGLTIPLQRHLKIKELVYGQPLERRSCWDLHVLTLHGCSCLLAVHCSSRYTFTQFDLTAADWGDLMGTFERGLWESLLATGYPKTQVEYYLQQAGIPECTKTHGRREVAFLNRAWDDVVSMDYTISTAQKVV